MQLGVIVLGQRRGSIADNLGLQRGDILLKINGRSIETVHDIRKALRKHRSKWKITIRRGSRILNTDIPG